MGPRNLRILVLTFYYPPDLSAGSFRSNAVVRALSKVVPKDSSVDVVAGAPNRYRSYRATSEMREQSGAVTVHRLPLPPHASGVADQSRAFAAFALGALSVTRGVPYDLVYATSSRLMTASLGALIAKRARARLYLDIRDIFVDTITQVRPRVVGRFLSPLFSFLEGWTVKSASRVNLVSPGFQEYFAQRYPEKRYSFFTNGVDDEFLRERDGDISSLAMAPSKFPLRIVYAGNIGEGQGLDALLPELARQLMGRAEFRVIGDGGRRRELQRRLEAAGVQNVQMLDPMPRQLLVAEYRQADVLLLHLNDYPAFEKVLPSKVFEYAAVGKPILAGVGGYAARFLLSEVENAAVFPPCRVKEALAALDTLNFVETPRREFLRRYSRAQICSEMAKQIVETARGS